MNFRFSTIVGMTDNYRLPETNLAYTTQTSMINETKQSAAILVAVTTLKQERYEATNKISRHKK